MVNTANRWMAFAAVILMAASAAAVFAICDTEDSEAAPAGNLTWTFDDGTLTISGSGKMNNYQSNKDLAAPWLKNYADKINSIIIGEGVTSIGNYAFKNCSALTSVSLPSSLASIGGSAFDSCNALTSIAIPDSVTTIGNSAFRNCYALTSVSLPSSLASIGSNAFDSCNALTSIAIPDSVTTIGSSAFNFCTSLTSVTIPGSVTFLANDTFASCDSLTSVTIKDGVTRIATGSFSWCKSLVSITIPDSVTTIYTGAFDRDNSLKVVFASEATYNLYSWPAGVTRADGPPSSSVTSISGFVNTLFSKEIISDSTYTISIEGCDWLSVPADSPRTVTGTPTAAGTWTLTVHYLVGGADTGFSSAIDVRVSSVLAPTNSPNAGTIIMPVGV